MLIVSVQCEPWTSSYMVFALWISGYVFVEILLVDRGWGGETLIDPPPPFSSAGLLVQDQ